MTTIPGRFLGGLSLVLGPLTIATAVALRSGYDFFFPSQLAEYAVHPRLVVISSSAFVVGTVLLWPGLLTLAQRIAPARPRLAWWGCVLAITGLFKRAFDAGADYLAYELVRVQGLAVATQAVADSYSGFNIMRTASPAIMAGWVVLAIGAWRSGVLGLAPAIALGAVAALPMGVLKGSHLGSQVAAAGLLIALVPLGVRVLRDGPWPGWRRVALGAAVTVVVGTAFVVLGTLG
jgi:hypothetical protein